MSDTPGPWWKKRRFFIPGALLGAVMVVGAVSGGVGTDDDSEAEPSTKTTSTVAPETTITTTTVVVATTSTPVPEAVTIFERPVSIDEVAVATAALAGAEVLDDLGAPVPYRRTEYSDGWGDADNDCLSDRHEILLERSEVPAVIQDCLVANGQWTDPYDGSMYTDARTVTIDHFVPLAAAHRAGGWEWDFETKQAFAADITYRPSHVPAGQATNEAKGDKEPHLWRPQESSWCAYAIDWVSVKTRWGLAYSTDEADALDEMLETCEPTLDTPATTAPLAGATTSTTASSTTTSIAITSADAVVRISSCDARGETVELINSGGESITLSGWVLHDEGRNHETSLSGVTLGRASSIVLLSGEDTADIPDAIRWATQNVWNNGGDEAVLVNADGIVASRLRCSG